MNTRIKGAVPSDAAKQGYDIIKIAGYWRVRRDCYLLGTFKTKEEADRYLSEYRLRRNTLETLKAKGRT